MPCFAIHRFGAMLFVLLMLSTLRLSWAGWISIDKEKGTGIYEQGIMRYEGGYRNGKRHGKGVETTTLGARYEGDFADDKYHGTGVMTWANGRRHEGAFVKGEPHGHGISTYADGMRIETEYIHGSAMGPGSIVWGNGQRYEGEILSSEPNGKGVMTWPDGQRYEGEFLDGKLHGRGIMMLGGQRYEGSYSRSLRHGYGTLTYENGERYSGEFIRGERTGRGVLNFQNGERYAGDFVKGRAEGQGKYLWPSGEAYMGEWKGGVRHGKGVRFRADGRREEHEWENNELRNSRPLSPATSNSDNRASSSVVPTTLAGPKGIDVSEDSCEAMLASCLQRCDDNPRTKKLIAANIPSGTQEYMSCKIGCSRDDAICTGENTRGVHTGKGMEIPKRFKEAAARREARANAKQPNTLSKEPVPFSVFIETMGDMSFVRYTNTSRNRISPLFQVMITECQNMSGTSCGQVNLTYLRPMSMWSDPLFAADPCKPYSFKANIVMSGTSIVMGSAAASGGPGNTDIRGRPCFDTGKIADAGARQTAPIQSATTEQVAPSTPRVEKPQAVPSLPKPAASSCGKRGTIILVDGFNSIPGSCRTGRLDNQVLSMDPSLDDEEICNRTAHPYANGAPIPEQQISKMTGCFCAKNVVINTHNWPLACWTFYDRNRD